MNLRELIQQVYHEPALITPAAHASIRALLESRLGQSLTGADAASLEPDAARKGTDWCGRAVEIPQAYVDDDGIGHIPIGGALGQSLKPFDRGQGAVDTLDVRDELAAFAQDKKVKGVILDFDSPGGMVLGTPETADAIAEFPKPIYAFTRGLIASAAYWLAVASDGIYATPSSSIGSIGTVITYYDQTERARMAGIKVEVIKTGKYKGMGTPGTGLNDDHRAFLQERVDAITDQFKAHVRKHRGAVANDTMQGQTFMAGDALTARLIDGVVRTKADVAAKILHG